MMEFRIWACSFFPWKTTQSNLNYGITNLRVSLSQIRVLTEGASSWPSSLNMSSSSIATDGQVNEGHSRVVFPERKEPATKFRLLNRGECQLDIMMERPLAVRKHESNSSFFDL